MVLVKGDSLQMQCVGLLPKVGNGMKSSSNAIHALGDADHEHGKEFLLDIVHFSNSPNSRLEQKNVEKRKGEERERRGRGRERKKVGAKLDNECFYLFTYCIHSVNTCATASELGSRLKSSKKEGLS